MDHALLHSFGVLRSTAVHFVGHVLFPNDLSEINYYKKEQKKNNCGEYQYNIWDVEVKVLFDTGALCANYVSKSLFEDIKLRMKPCDIKKQATRISLADDSKTVHSEEVIKLTLNIFGDKKAQQHYVGEFVVINMKQNDVIIGLPSIFSELWDFFKCAIEARRPQGSKPTNTPQDTYDETDESLHLTEGEIVSPWELTSDVEAPEEAEVPLPTQFDFATTFLGKSREQAFQDYTDMFKEHIEPSFLEATNIRELLMGKGLQVFVPTSWDGITGINPLHIDFKDSMPDRIKPKARPVNPRLWDVAAKEFKRLSGYFYEPSRSPWASCLVVAPKATPPFIRFCGDYVRINQFIPTGHFNIPNIRHELDKIIGYKIYLDTDLQCQAYYEFCEQRNHLYHLTLDTAMAKRYQTQLRKQDITTVDVGDRVFIYLRFFGDVWYEALDLPDGLTTSYVFAFSYTHWYHKTSKRKISGRMDIAHEHCYSLDTYAVFCWGAQLTFDPLKMVMVDEPLVKQYPAITA